MPTLDGKTYEMQYLTDEETAVINAMRMGGKAHLISKRNQKTLQWATSSTNKKPPIAVDGMNKIL